MRLSYIMIGFVLTMILTSSATMLYGSIEQEYPQATGYDNTDLESYQENIDKVNDEVNQTAAQITNIQNNPLVPDLLGAVLIGGIGALSQLDNVLDIMFSAFTDLLSLIPLGPIGRVIIAAMTTVGFIMFFIQVLLPAIVKRDL